jgi:hypothetical protein
LGRVVPKGKVWKMWVCLDPKGRPIPTSIDPVRTTALLLGAEMNDREAAKKAGYATRRVVCVIE